MSAGVHVRPPSPTEEYPATEHQPPGHVDTGYPRTGTVITDRDVHDQLQGPGDVIIPLLPSTAPPVAETARPGAETIPDVGGDYVHPHDAPVSIPPPLGRPYSPARTARTAYPESPRARPIPPGHVDERYPSGGPLDLEQHHHYEDARARMDALGDKMEHMLDELQEEEAKRDENFKANEEDRETMFRNNEARRDEEAQARRDGIWDELERRLGTMPGMTEGALPVPPPGTSVLGDMPEPETPLPPPGEQPQPVVPASTAETELLAASMLEAATRHAEDIRNTVDKEREELQREREAAQVERERAQAEAAAERERMHAEYQAHIRALESELGAVRKELEDEKMAREAEEAERRETERAEMLERDEAMRAQLGDITNLVSEQRDELARKRELTDERWEFKQNRWDQKDAEDAQTRNMLQQILEGQSAMLAAQEQSKADLLDEMRASM